MSNSHLLTFRSASCSAYSSSMGTPCCLRCCCWVRSSRRASFGRKLLAHTWEGHRGMGLTYLYLTIARVPRPCCPSASPCCHQVESPTISDTRNSSKQGQ